ncbi:MAG: hypothetical protein GX443_06780 [Deltaproteobacteria bacterium]|nr:hypothetical protein [Deltaproteobacteria bacterium]
MGEEVEDLRSEGAVAAGGGVLDEERRLRRLRRMIDMSLALIAQTDLDLLQAQKLVQVVKDAAMELFPGKEATFELIYTPRFRRLLAEKYAMH